MNRTFVWLFLVLLASAPMTRAQCSQCVPGLINQFPLVGVEGSTVEDAAYWVVLSEQTTCTFNAATDTCIITGTVTFEPANMPCCDPNVDWVAVPTSNAGTINTNSSFARFQGTTTTVDDTSPCLPNSSGQVIFAPTSVAFACNTAGSVLASIRLCSRPGVPIVFGGLFYNAVKNYSCQ